MTQTTKQTPSEILTAAREKLTPPSAWIQGHLAQDDLGNSVYPTDAAATCFCSLGAINSVAETGEARIDAKGFLRAVTDGIVAFNDSPYRTQEEVLAAFDAAIEAAKAKEAAAAQKVVIDNLQELRAAVVAQPDAEFDLSFYKQDKESGCGALFCTAGLAASMPHFQAQGMTLTAWDSYGKTLYDVEIDGYHISDCEGTPRLFGEGAWYNCFAPRNGGERDDQFPIREQGGWGGGDQVASYISDKALAIWRLDQQIIAEKAKVAA